jgi:hypothetical protein
MHMRRRFFRSAVPDVRPVLGTGRSVRPQWRVLHSDEHVVSVHLRGGILRQGMRRIRSVFVGTVSQQRDVRQRVERDVPMPLSARLRRFVLRKTLALSQRTVQEQRRLYRHLVGSYDCDREVPVRVLCRLLWRRVRTGQWLSSVPQQFVFEWRDLRQHDHARCNGMPMRYRILRSKLQ